jgi:membrane protein YdbS with pleckstrin-like domain
METRHLQPDQKYLTKMRLVMVFIAALVLLGGLLLGWLISLDERAGVRGFNVTLLVTAILDVLWWVPAMLLSGPYYRSLAYEVREDEIVVQQGIWTKSIKHVPYRTVTNLALKRGILDRWLGIGRLEVQTAGISGSSAPEESLAGLTNVREVYEGVAAELRRFQGGMAPTAAGTDQESPAPAGAAALQETLNSLLDEVRAIRRALDRD